MMKTGMRKWMVLAACCAVSGAGAVTTAELNALMDQGVKITVVDIRESNFYRAGHIPNAINIPQRVVARKKLPALGRVVVYGRGFGTEDVAYAVRMLNEKGGIDAEALDGGYAAWEMDKGTTTEPVGFKPEQLDYITYQDISDLSADDVVLVDLRKPEESAPGRVTRQGITTDAPTLTALDEKFPGRPVVKSPFEVDAVARRTGGSEGVSRMSSEPEKVPVMVLIDNGDGEAEKIARMLRANGFRRVVILAGGERIIERDGAPGLKRMGMGAQTVEEDDE
ncbi:rhodanese-like domain-containing protein [Pontiellaceae bacterium B1224]|nr:rhodanese-like domain-containing protein [Pontiellaceae bacterium B1224]